MSTPTGKYCNYHNESCSYWNGQDKCSKYPNVILFPERESFPENGDYTGYIFKCTDCLKQKEKV